MTSFTRTNVQQNPLYFLLYKPDFPDFNRYKAFRLHLNLKALDTFSLHSLSAEQIACLPHSLRSTLFHSLLVTLRQYSDIIKPLKF